MGRETEATYCRHQSPFPEALQSFVYFFLERPLPHKPLTPSLCCNTAPAPLRLLIGAFTSKSYKGFHIPFIQVITAFIDHPSHQVLALPTRVSNLERNDSFIFFFKLMLPNNELPSTQHNGQFPAAHHIHIQFSSIAQKPSKQLTDWETDLQIHAHTFICLAFYPSLASPFLKSYCSLHEMKHFYIP